MSEPRVGYQVREGVATLALDAPPVNGYSYEMMRALDDGILKARFDDDVHVIVLTGAGDRFFCAGADINKLATMSQSYKYQFCLHANETLLRLEHTPKLVIAALNGHTVGGGLEVALACDLRVAKKDGGKLGLPEVALGVLPGTGGTQRLVRVVGKSRALEMMVSGRNMSFDEALEMGLVHEVMEGDFGDAVHAYARGFCPPAKAALAVGLIKRAVQTGAEVPLESGLALERELQARLFQSGDAGEGLAAYLEKRKPGFSGR
ncbi:MAG: enoyl-CoA hydratase/isomerase family protein [Planctomycetota bacterium]|nr:enoyl-CoA hydratase/isomerase family protein [Planctomycetota bacterium]